ncbi:PREDICTED: uncharacterized protein LOC106786456 [Polistes canadensis]|uniref:uncharacterized protein LOC106786456 n=1 Tax=Polistes canadensis TaxID=91411 RepID=UPI0007190679|nr:PREDICTED: uncharacterized protein LOC106786456 [Polistes canadensis]
MLRKEKEILNITGKSLQRRSQNSMDINTFIWQEYEFGTNAGNRDEVVITNISIEEDLRLPRSECHWILFESNGNNYLACSSERTLFLYTLDIKGKLTTSNFAEFNIDGRVLTFTLIDVESTTKLRERNDIIAVVCVEKNATTSLQWYRIYNQEFELFRTWNIERPAKDIQFVRYRNKNKLLLLFNRDDYEITRIISVIDIYSFSIDFVKKDYHFWLTQEIQASSIRDMQLCKVYEHTVLALLGKNEVFLYEQKENDDDYGTFELWQTIKSNNLNNFICFESGHAQYLATSGKESALFYFADNAFQYNSKTENIFNAFSEIAWVEEIPVETYRDESLLLIQLLDSTIYALTWQGDHRFKVTSLPNVLLNNFDLSNVTSIPRYGFVSGNVFAKIDTKLNQLSSPIEDKIIRMMEAKALLQEQIINEIDERFDLIDHINYTQIKSLNASKIITTNLSMENDVSYTINLDSKNLTREDIITNMTLINKSLRDLTERCNTLKLDLQYGSDEDSMLVVDDLNISGDLRLRGNLYVEEFSTNSLNDLPMLQILQQYLTNDSRDAVVNGEKSFSDIEATNAVIRKINGIPFEQIMFEESKVHYSNMNMSNKIYDLTIDGHLTFSKINNIKWENIVWKNKLAFIPDKTTINGKIEGNYVNARIVNDLSYPYDYVLEEGSIPVHVTGIKNFDRLTVQTLSQVSSINDIAIDEFVTLDNDHIFNRNITFRNITVLGSFTIDANISGFNVSQLKQEALINETQSLTSNVILYNLTVLGNVYLEDSINANDWSDFEDLLSINDSRVEILGKKDFRGNVAIDGSSIYITSNKINGHAIEEFLTLDTDQTFTSLKEISDNVTFGEISNEFANNLRKILEEETKENSHCTNKSVILENTLIVDDLSFDILNDNITSDTFKQQLNLTFRNVSFNDLTVNKLNVQEITPIFVNNVNLSDFIEFAVTRSTMQNVSVNCSFERLQVENLEIERFNGMSIKGWNDLIDQLHRSYRDIFDPNIATLESIIVKGMIDASSINGISLDKMYDPSTMGTVIYENGLYVENLTVLGFINNFNISELVKNAVLKIDDEIVINDVKEFENIHCKLLQMKSFNGHDVNNILDPYKDQDLTGPVVINGTANVVGSFDARGKIQNKLYFRDLINRFRKLNDETCELNVNVRFVSAIEIIDLKMNGTIDGIDFNELVDSIVLKNEDNVTLSGGKRLKGSLMLNESFVIIDEAINDINLKRFYEKAIFIDEPLTMNSSVVFLQDIVLKKNLDVVENLDVNWIGGVDIDNLKDVVVYLNLPYFFPAPTTFTSINFIGDASIKHWNNIDMSSVIVLPADQIISNEFIRAFNITVEDIDIRRNINERNLNEIYTDTLMKIGNQNVTGNLTFLGKVLMRHDFNPRLMNHVNPKQIVLVNTNDTIIGNVEFEKEVVLNGSLRVLDRFNEIDLIGWQATAVTTNHLSDQLISGKWKIRGKVYLKGSIFTNGGLLNGFNSTELADLLEQNQMAMETSLTESTTNLSNLCRNVVNLQYHAKSQIYKFNAFEYLQETIELKHHLLSVHYFEIQNLDLLLISYESCHLDAYQYNGKIFKLIASIPNFGYVQNWITLNHNDSLYFLVTGKQKCARNSTNLWKLDNNEFVHVYQFEDVQDVKKFNNDTFLLLFADRLESRTIQQIYNNESFRSNPNYYVTNVEDHPLKFVSNTDRILLNNRYSIYELDKSLTSYTFSNNRLRSSEILSMKVGIFEKEYFLHYNPNFTRDNIFISDNDLNETKVLQIIPTNNPSSFSIIHFEGSLEMLLIFIENNKSLKVYEYKGIQGFVHRDTIKIQAEKISILKILKYNNMARRHCLAVIDKNRLTILEAKMHGERLDMHKLPCILP